LQAKSFWDSMRPTSGETSSFVLAEISGGYGRGQPTARLCDVEMNMAYDLTQAYQTGLGMQQQVLAGYQKRYDDAMAQLASWGTAQREDLVRRYRDAATQGMAGLIGSGMQGSTIMPSVMMGYTRQQQQALNSLDEQLTRERMNYQNNLMGDLLSYQGQLASRYPTAQEMALNERSERQLQLQQEAQAWSKEFQQGQLALQNRSQDWTQTYQGGQLDLSRQAQTWMQQYQQQQLALTGRQVTTQEAAQAWLQQYQGGQLGLQAQSLAQQAAAQAWLQNYQQQQLALQRQQQASAERYQTGQLGVAQGAQAWQQRYQQQQLDLSKAMQNWTQAHQARQLGQEDTRIALSSSRYPTTTYSNSTPYSISSVIQPTQEYYPGSMNSPTFSAWWTRQWGG
jgi:hypothetical protein